MHVLYLSGNCVCVGLKSHTNQWTEYLKHLSTLSTHIIKCAEVVVISHSQHFDNTLLC